MVMRTFHSLRLQILTWGGCQSTLEKVSSAKTTIPFRHCRPGVGNRFISDCGLLRDLPGDLWQAVLAVGLILAQGSLSGEKLTANNASAASATGAPWFITTVDSTTLALGVSDVGQYASRVINPVTDSTYISCYDVTNRDLKAAKYKCRVSNLEGGVEYHENQTLFESLV
jgi:hypothetical protein